MASNSKRKDLLGLKKRSLSLKFGQKEDMPFSPLLPRMGGPTLASPMTTLSAFMGDLNCEGSTPKRRLSLSSTGDTPVSSRASSQSSDLGQPVFYIGSPTADESPFGEQSAGLSAFRRYNSLPSPQAGPDPPVFSLAKEMKGEEGTNGCLATEVDENESVRKRAETIMWEACNDQENIDVQRKIDTFKLSRPRQISFIETGTSEATTKERPISAPASLLEQSARPQTTVVNSPVKLQHCRLVSSNDDDEDGFTEIFMDSNQAPESGVPGSLCSLINAPLVISPPTPSSCDQALRDLDCNTLDDTPNAPKCRRTIFKVPSQPVMRRSSFLKRADRPRDTPSPVQSKRYRSCSDAHAPEVDREIEMQRNQSPRTRLLGRSYSMDEGRDYHRKVAMALNCDHTVLTGDRKKPDTLPLCEGKHQDLKSITPETVCKVLRSEIPVVKEHFILDCRYPYEYKGGHIKGAMNLYTKELVTDFFLATPMRELEGRVIIFHCEFSSKRGPDLLRFLRNKDRDANIDHYPNLYYPELYILYGGYKAFYENDMTMCDPQTYLPMEHEDYREDCKHFKAKSKSWAGERSRLGHRKTSVS